ncbi:hypothetical protein [Vibrio parahaemolyticus]|uniref:hypothetical protein n=1 Tax=Vibrio parahaemolyticus TaxID=670 RepID=UPI000471DA7A|nr:hypothetical protein [Vibrio parahaemolyticus]
MSVNFAFGKLLSFILVTFGIGLLQIWILLIALVLTNKPISVHEILGDGGLYFFSTVLALSSFITLTSHKADLSYGSTGFNISLIVLGLVTVIAIVAYVSVLTDKIGTPSPFSAQIASQIMCVCLASSYAFYVSTVTGVFKYE